MVTTHDTCLLREETQDDRFICCRLLSDYVGFDVYRGIIKCAQCFNHGQHLVPVVESEMNVASCKNFLRIGLLQGSSGEFHIDMIDAFRRFQKVATREEQKAMFVDMLSFQANHAEETKLVPVELVLERLGALIKECDLNEMVNELFAEESTRDRR